MTFDWAWSEIEIGEEISVSDGAAEPRDPASLAWRQWRSRNVIGTLTEKLIGPPRMLTVRVVTDAATTDFHIPESAVARVRRANPSPQEVTEEAWRVLREERDRRLAATDWTQLADVNQRAPGTAERWAPYRTALADLPAKTKDPTKPRWPSPPAT